MSYGTQTFGDETFGGADLLITAISPSKVDRLGGTLVTLQGTFPTDQTYLVRVDGVLAHSGVRGQGTVIQSTGDTLSFVVPAFEASAVGSLTVEVETVPGADTVQTTLDVLERYFGSAAFELRRMYPSWHGLGPRRLELEPQEQ